MECGGRGEDLHADEGGHGGGRGDSSVAAEVGVANIGAKYDGEGAGAREHVEERDGVDRSACVIVFFSVRYNSIVGQSRNRLKLLVRLVSWDNKSIFA